MSYIIIVKKTGYNWIPYKDSDGEPKVFDYTKSAEIKIDKLPEKIDNIPTKYDIAQAEYFCCTCRYYENGKCKSSPPTVVLDKEESVEVDFKDICNNYYKSVYPKVDELNRSCHMHKF